MEFFVLDFDGTKFVRKSYNGINKEDLSNLPDINLIERDRQYRYNQEVLDSEIDRLNRLLTDEFDFSKSTYTIMVKKCKDCGKYFIINYREFIFYYNKKFPLPERCHKCREQRKRQKDEKMINQLVDILLDKGAKYYIAAYVAKEDPYPWFLVCKKMDYGSEEYEYVWVDEETFKEMANSHTKDHPFIFDTKQDAIQHLKTLGITNKCQIKVWKQNKEGK